MSTLKCSLGIHTERRECWRGGQRNAFSRAAGLVLLSKPWEEAEPCPDSDLSALTSHFFSRLNRKVRKTLALAEMVLRKGKQLT